MKELVDFKTAFVDMVDAAGEPGPHPEARELGRFRGGELSGPEAERVREHLVGCRECVAFLRSPPEDAPDPRSDFELAAFWRNLRPRLEEPPRPRWHDRRRLFAMAAGFAAGLFGPGLWVLVQQRTLEEQERTIETLSAPWANVAIHDLVAAEARDGSGREGAVMAAGQGGHLLLTPLAVAEHSEYAVRILDSSGKPVRTVEGLVPDPEDHTISLVVPPGFLEPGDYTLELYVQGPGDGAPPERYRLEVT